MNDGARGGRQGDRREARHLQRQQRPGGAEQRHRDLHRPEGERLHRRRHRRQRHHAGGQAGGEGRHPGRWRSTRCCPRGRRRARSASTTRAPGGRSARCSSSYVEGHAGGKAKVGIVGALNSFIQNLRQKGFEDTIKAGKGVTVAGVVDGRNIQDNALAAAENLMTGNPDLNAVYATGEPALVGAVAAVETRAAKDRVKIFGWDLTEQAIKGIDDGFVVAVVQQDPAGEGAAAVEAAVDARQRRHRPAQDRRAGDHRHQGERRQVPPDVQVSDRRRARLRKGRRRAAAARPRVRLRGIRKALRLASRRCAGSTSTCGRARCWAWSATTPPASRR